MTSTAAALADQYFAMWNETDEDRRGKIIEEAWSTDGVFVDPSFEVKRPRGPDRDGRQTPTSSSPATPSP